MIREFEGRMIDFRKVSYVGPLSLRPHRNLTKAPKAVFCYLIDGHEKEFEFYNELEITSEKLMEMVEERREVFIGLMKMATKDRQFINYVADYIAEEISRNMEINSNTIQNAFDAYEGGAR